MYSTAGVVISVLRNKSKKVLTKSNEVQVKSILLENHSSKKQKNSSTNVPLLNTPFTKDTGHYIALAGESARTR